MLPLRLALILFVSGFCSLVYQIAWLRQFRLIFGASTLANGAVVAIFIGGLGVGGLLFGRRIDRHARPLWLYARIEGGIALSTAVTPLLLYAARASYIALGGSLALGSAGATAVRLLLSTLVLAVPTILMGATLPAAARAAETNDDAGRRITSLFYGVNTLGAVTGALLATFLLLEALGTVRTLWLACAVNGLIAVLANVLARRYDAKASSTGDNSGATTLAPASAGDVSTSTRRFVLVAAALVGFAFFLMELVWYRMLAPLLGGTVFTFGLILAVALLGVGAGGMAYGSWSRQRRATILGFAITCLVEALLLAIPYALGDSLALFALLMRPLGTFGFAGYVLGWSAVCMIVVFPGAFIAGVQFPMLIALLGSGQRNVGRDVGQTYASNTLGAVVGSLAGGFGLLALLGALLCWQLVCLLLLCLGLVATGLASRERHRVIRLPIVLALVTLALVSLPRGPTHVWRHASIGAGRAPRVFKGENGRRAWAHTQRTNFLWTVDGRESSIGVGAHDGLALYVNGKSDGSVRTDVETVVFLGLIPAALHPAPRRAMVVGLGTGTTAGWLAQVPELQRVDVVEFEPAVLRFARQVDAATFGAMKNPKVHTIIGDAREVLLTNRERYDLIISEPSNPYRAGIASLFTREFYQAAAQRLGKRGIFAQWVQGYEIDARTLGSVVATLGSVLPHVTIWAPGKYDLLVLASKAPITVDLNQLAQRLGTRPFRDGLELVWRTSGVEGFLAHHLASEKLTRRMQQRFEAWINTDDLNQLEFGFARSLAAGGSTTADLLRTAKALGADRSQLEGTPKVAWTRVEELRRAHLMLGAGKLSAAAKARLRARRLVQKDQRRAYAFWQQGGEEPRDATELLIVALGLALRGEDAKAEPYLQRLARMHPAEASFVRAEAAFQQRRFPEAEKHLLALFRLLASDLWASPTIVVRGLHLTKKLAQRDPGARQRLYLAIAKPFPIYIVETTRKLTVLALASMQLDRRCLDVLQPYEPDPPWARPVLLFRRDCYRRFAAPLAPAASEDLRRFDAASSLPLWRWLGLQ